MGRNRRLLQARICGEAIARAATGRSSGRGWFFQRSRARFAACSSLDPGTVILHPFFDSQSRWRLLEGRPRPCLQGALAGVSAARILRELPQVPGERARTGDEELRRALVVRILALAGPLTPRTLPSVLQMAQIVMENNRIRVWPQKQYDNAGDEMETEEKEFELRIVNLRLRCGAAGSIVLFPSRRRLRRDSRAIPGLLCLPGDRGLRIGRWRAPGAAPCSLATPASAT